jgi:HK97 family phage portal protein
MFRNSASLATPEEWLVRELLRNTSAAGIHITPLRALGIATVYSCVNAISRTVSTLPLKLHRRLGNGGSEIVEDHPANRLFAVEPNPEMTPASMRWAIQANACLRNVGRGLVVRNGLQELAEIWPIAHQDLKVSRASANAPLTYKLKDKVVSPSSVLEIKGLTFDGVMPADALIIARDTVGLAVALQDNASKFFANGCKPAGVLEHPGSLSQGAQDRIRTQIEEKLKGSDKAYNLLILEEGLKFAAQRMDNTDSQFLESRVYQDKAIARFFGIPQHKVGILDNSHFNNVEQENINYVTDTIIPWVTQWEQELNRKCLSRDEQGVFFFKFNVAALARGDMKSRADALQVWRRNGIINQNEWRALEDLNPVPGGDVYLIDQTLVPVGTQPKQSNA